MAKFCCICGINNFGKDKLTGKYYCSRHQSYRTDLDKRSISQKALAKHQAQQKKLPPAKLFIETPANKELSKWFEHRKAEMTGLCYECGEASAKYQVDNTRSKKPIWKFSVCHILPKAIFPSVATHPLNFIELCYYGNSHHTNFDNNGFEYVKEKMPKSWAYIVKRFKLIYPYVSERSKIPDVLLQELSPEEADHA